MKHTSKLERGGVSGGVDGGDGYPDVFPATVQDSHGLDATDFVRRDIGESAYEAGLQSPDWLGTRAGVV